MTLSCKVWHDRIHSKGNTGSVLVYYWVIDEVVEIWLEIMNPVKWNHFESNGFTYRLFFYFLKLLYMQWKRISDNLYWTYGRGYKRKFEINSSSICLPHKTLCITINSQLFLGSVLHQSFGQASLWLCVGHVQGFPAAYFL